MRTPEPPYRRRSPAPQHDVSHRRVGSRNVIKAIQLASIAAQCAAGDGRLPDKLRREELVPLGSRIRTRLAIEAATRDELMACLEHLLAGAGNASLMTAELRHTLCDHAAGNYRILTAMAGELLITAAQRELAQLDEKLFLQVYDQTQTASTRRVAGSR